MTAYNNSHTIPHSEQVQKQKEERKKVLEGVYERRRMIAKRIYIKLRLKNRQGMI
jgi:hypothetical protein